MRLAASVLVFISSLVAYCHPCFAVPDVNPTDKVFVGYVAGMPSDINYKLYTHLCHAFVVAEEDGTLIPQENVPNHELARDAHQAGVKVLISLGGWGWDANFAAMSLDPAAEDRYVKAVMELVDKYDYDGIDLDWEYPDTNIEIVGFERLTRRFRKLLDELGEKKGRRMFVTMAASSHPGTLQWLTKDFLLETMDWINVMTYDYYGSWAKLAGNHSPLYVSSKMPKGQELSTELTFKYLKDRGIPANRMALGIPLYGRGFAVAEPYADTTSAPKPKHDSANYRRIVSLIENDKWDHSWDDETKNPWIAAPDKSEVLGYDDAKSIALKTKWANEQGLRGVFFWQIAGDRLPDGSNPLQQAAFDNLDRPAP